MTVSMALDKQQRRANIRLALILAAIAIGIFVAFVWSTMGGNG